MSHITLTPERYAAINAKNQSAKGIKLIGGIPFAVDADKDDNSRPALTVKHTPPTEHQEQVKVIAWCDKHPLACLIFAIPNGSHKSPAMAAKFKREGLRSGIPDLLLPVKRGAFAGLFIEMKRVRGSVTSEAQLDWHEALLAQGYQVKVCKGAGEAIKVIQEYLKKPIDNKGE